MLEVCATISKWCAHSSNNFGILYLQVKFIASTAAYYSNNQLIKHNENKCNQNVIEFL